MVEQGWIASRTETASEIACIRRIDIDHERCVQGQDILERLAVLATQVLGFDVLAFFGWVSLSTVQFVYLPTHPPAVYENDGSVDMTACLACKEQHRSHEFFGFPKAP